MLPAMTAAGFVGRVGGLAAALGVGVVIGLSTSAPASADQSDSASRSGSSADAPSASRRSAAGPERTATVGAAAARAAAATLKAPRSAADVAARVEQSAARLPKATATSLIAAVPTPVASAPTPAANTTVREARRAGAAMRSAPLATAPLVTAPVVTAAPAPVAGAPVAGATAAPAPAPRPGPIARALNALFNCDPRGRLITIYKGTHFAIPNNFGGFFVQKVQGTGTFTADSVYDLKDVDQFDWNKFTGIAFAPLEPDLNSVMVGWRYNLTTEEFEIGPYYNVDKARISPQGPSQIISVPVGETFNYLVDYTGVTLSYGDRTVYKPFPEGLTPNVWTAVRISGWFGGNEVAPRTVSYYIKFA